MKKTICICICIFLASGCDKSLNHGRPVNAVVKDRGSECVETPSLTSDTSASEPSNTPAPTPEPSKSAPPASGTPDIASLVKKYTFNVANIVVCTVTLALVALAIAGVYYYKPLYSFADDIKSIRLSAVPEVDKEYIAKLLGEGGMRCYYDFDDLNDFKNCHFFNCISHEYIDEIPVKTKVGEGYHFFYKPNSSKWKPLLRDIFGIKVPVSSGYVKPNKPINMRL